MNAKEALKQYQESTEKRKAEIKAEPKRIKRFFKKLWFWISYPFRWLFMECHDWRFLVIFIIVFLVMSSEIWVFYLLSFINWGSDFSKWCLGIASACWAFWLGPFTPFIPLCVAITIGIKTIFDKLKERHKKKMYCSTEEEYKKAKGVDIVWTPCKPFIQALEKKYKHEKTWWLIPEILKQNIAGADDSNSFIVTRAEELMKFDPIAKYEEKPRKRSGALERAVYYYEFDNELWTMIVEESVPTAVSKYVLNGD